MSTDPKSQKQKRGSLADYVIRYDLATLIEEARLDYSQSAAGGPRLLAQADIAARFRKTARRPKPANE